MVPSDYDTDPGRFAANPAIRHHFTEGDVFAAVAQRLTATPAASPVLELGGGTGPLARQLAGTTAT